MKLLICGHGRHGKDTVAELLLKYAGLSFTSSSWHAASRIFTEAPWAAHYESLQQCYDDRANHRAEWHDFIAEYNREAPVRMCREIFTISDIYVGMRSEIEFAAAREITDLTIWVDASERHPPEPRSSNKVEARMCDIVIENNGTLSELEGKVARIASIIRSAAE